jgi:G patch domain/KOW motif-containing protein
MPHIRVKILDKVAGKGSLYLKKAVVLDVHPGKVADVKVEETHQLLTLSEGKLETVVPKAAGAVVMLVGGEHRGRRGRLLEMSSRKGVAAVQLTGDMEVVRVVLDDVAQYMGVAEEEED